MNKWLLVCAGVLFFIQWMYINIKESYKLQYEIVYTEKKEDMKNNIKLFIMNRGMFANVNDIEELKKAMKSNIFDSALLNDSGQQELLNNSKENRKIKIRQWAVKNIILITNFLKKFTWKDIITISFYVLLPFIVWRTTQIDELDLFYNTLFGKLLGIDEISLELYLAQLSLTFITISVMSIFSDGNVIIYWQNVVRQMLIDPIARCFKAYFGYSFFYLLISTLFLLSGDVYGLIIMFLFNIVCLFDLSRIMIGCYYGQKTKKEHLIKSFINEIEKANLAFFRILKKSENEKLGDKTSIDEVIGIFDTFNDYTIDAYNSEKYITLKENLEAYGKILPYVNSAVITIDQFPLMDWYNDKTYRYYRNVVKNYYSEYFSLILGNGYSNTSTPRSGIEKEIIHNIIFELSNDIHNHLEANDCFELVLYKFLEMVYLAARNEDGDNLGTYRIEIKEGYGGNWLYKNRKLIGEKFERLTEFYNREIPIPKCPELDIEKSKEELVPEIQKYLANKNIYKALLQYEFKYALVELMGDVVLFNTKDAGYFNFSWLPLKKLYNINTLFEEVKNYVKIKSKKLSEERQALCDKRLGELKDAIDLILGEK